MDILTPEMKCRPQGERWIRRTEFFRPATTSGATMATFRLRDLENLKRSGISIQDIHFNVSNTILNSEDVSANIRTLDRDTGKFEIVLTGTIARNVLEKDNVPSLP